MKHVLDHFKKNDPIIFKCFQSLEFPVLQKHDNLFVALCESIVSQQLSIKAADTIFKRFQQLFPEEKITPIRTITLSKEQLRAVGMSYGKASYVLDLAEKVSSNQLVLEKLHDLEDEAVIAELTKVKGIGRWTAEMFLMFALGREDIFSYGDLGIRKAIFKLYNLKGELSQNQAEKIAQKWSPYKTYACKILWKSL